MAIADEKIVVMQESEYLKQKMGLAGYARSITKMREDFEGRLNRLEKTVQQLAMKMDIELAQQQAHREKANILLKHIEDYLKEWT